MSLYLPPAEAGAQAEPLPSPDYDESRGAGTVLVIDDNAAVARTTSRALESRGYEVLMVDNAEAALRILSDTAQILDAMVTDVVMPGMGGIELAAEARQLRPHLPVLFVSGYATAALAAHGAPPGEHQLLAKPFSAAVLARKLRELMVATATHSE